MTAKKGTSKTDLRSELDMETEDLQFAISMLRIKLGSTTNLSEKIRYYGQIKALQENIDKLNEEAKRETGSSTSPK